MIVDSEKESLCILLIRHELQEKLFKTECEKKIPKDNSCWLKILADGWPKRLCQRESKLDDFLNELKAATWLLEGGLVEVGQR